MKRHVFLIMFCVTFLSGCYQQGGSTQAVLADYVMPIQSTAVAVANTQSTAKAVQQEDCSAKGGKWYSVYIRDNWGSEGLLFYFLEGKNKYIDISLYNETPTGFSSSKKLLDMNLTEKETINLCMKRIGTQDYTTTGPLSTYDATTHSWKHETLSKKATAFEVLKNTNYKCQDFRCH